MNKGQPSLVNLEKCVSLTPTWGIVRHCCRFTEMGFSAFHVFLRSLQS